MINLFSWSDALATGFSDIDLQHKKLISIIDDVFQIAQTPDGNYALRMAKALKALTDYTEYHFSEEELFMRSRGYPGFEGHRLQHSDFVGKVNLEIRSLAALGPEDAYIFYRFLGTWLLDHIAKSDKAWAEWIQERGKD